MTDISEPKAGASSSVAALREQVALNCMLWRMDSDGDWPIEKVRSALAAKDAEHSGDCTKQPWTCLRCEADAAYKQADEILSILSLISTVREERDGSSQSQPVFGSVPLPTREAQPSAALTDAQVKHMVNRFLGWRLPDPFRPDNGITFTPTQHQRGEYAHAHWPSGTNLFDATQADAMVRHMVEGLPVSSADGWLSWPPPEIIGQEVLAYRDDAGVLLVVFANSREDGDRYPDYTGEPAWFTAQGDDLTGQHPSHWRPIPPSPQPEGEEG